MISYSKAIDTDHDISDHHYYDNCTVYSNYCSYYGCIVVTITVIYVYNEQYDIVTVHNTIRTVYRESLAKENLGDMSIVPVFVRKRS